MSRQAIGFIGLGLMGSAMVSRLQDQGYQLTVIANRSRTAIDRAVGRGVSEASSYRELAAASDIVMLCVDTSDTVESCMRGDDGVIAGLRPGAIVVDSGTSLGKHAHSAPRWRPPGAACWTRRWAAPRACAGRQAEHHGRGGPRRGERAAPVLKDVGENVFHLGDLGAGHTVKLLNNFLGMTTANAVAELFAAADLAGVDRAECL